MLLADVLVQDPESKRIALEQFLLEDRDDEWDDH